MGCTDKNKRTDPIMTNSAALRVLYDLAGGRMKTWGALGRELGAMLGEDLAAGKPSAVVSGPPSAVPSGDEVSSAAFRAASIGARYCGGEVACISVTAARCGVVPGPV